MTLGRAAAVVVALLAGAVLLFAASVRQLTGSWLAFGTHPEVLAQLEASLADQKRLAAADPAHAAAYRRRFEGIEALAGRLRILRYNREEIAGRYRAALLIVFATLAALGVGAHLVAKAREQARLGRLRAALARLAAGDADVGVGAGERRRRDLLGRMAGMIEDVSRGVARDRRRLASLENLAAWQEAARRHAHEIRTPLTAARLELDRLERLLAAEMDAGLSLSRGRQLTASVAEELDRLARFTAMFASFARVPQPRLHAGDLAAFAADFAQGFAGAWPNLELCPPQTAAAAPAAFDRDLLRQVLVNLCTNSSLAIGDAAGDGNGGDGAGRTPDSASGCGDGCNDSGGRAACDDGARTPDSESGGGNGGDDRDRRKDIVDRSDSDPHGDGGRTADGRRGTVSFALAAGDGWVALTVADDGPGVAAAVLARLFEPYATTRRVGLGMGLGLAISRKILLDHGGDLELVGTSPEGTAFRLLLPAAAAGGGPPR